MESLGAMLKQGDWMLRARQAQEKAKLAESRSGPEPEYECARCKDEGGWLEKRMIDYGTEVYPMDVWVDCRCQEQNKIRRLFAVSEITPAMQRLRFDSFRTDERPPVVKEAFDTAREFTVMFKEIRETRHNGIYLGGEPGSGKTHLLMAAANELMLEGNQVLYFPFVEGMDELKSDMNDREKYREKEQRLQRIPILFIDDLFKRKKGSEPTDYEIKFMFSVINYRYLNHLPIMVSSELDLHQLLYWDAAIGSRIAEMTARYQVILRGDPDLNYRLPPA